MRTLLNGKRIKGLMREYQWNMGSKCPQKYLIVDCETGDLWVPNPEKRWVGPNKDLLESAKKAIGGWKRLQTRKDKLVALTRMGLAICSDAMNGKPIDEKLKRYQDDARKLMVKI